MRVRHDRQRDPRVVVGREYAVDRAPGRGGLREVVRAGVAAGLDHRAVGQLDQRGIALADVEERHPQRAGRRGDRGADVAIGDRYRSRWCDHGYRDLRPCAQGARNSLRRPWSITPWVNPIRDYPSGIRTIFTQPMLSDDGTRVMAASNGRSLALLMSRLGNSSGCLSFQSYKHWRSPRMGHAHSPPAPQACCYGSSIRGRGASGLLRSPAALDAVSTTLTCGPTSLSRFR